MGYSVLDVIEFVKAEDVKFIRLAFCDAKGNLKNISIMPNELERAFRDGISFDASAISGFESVAHSDLFLIPDPSTLTILPWRPSHGKVVRLFCEIKNPDGSEYNADSRAILKRAVAEAEKRGLKFNFGAEFEFYLFKTDENGEKTFNTYDEAGYMDVAPSDKGENIRREVCLTLEEMGILPESSHHEEGPGQNEIDFRYSDPLSTADHSIVFKNVVNTVASRNGLWASFSPKPVKGKSGNGMHINMSATLDGKSVNQKIICGIMKRIREITLFLNPCAESYQRLGAFKAPKYVSWSSENRSQLIRVPATKSEFERVELRSPDPCANPYLAYALLIYATIEAIENDLQLANPLNIDLYNAPKEIADTLERLPSDLKEAREMAKSSEFVKKYLPAKIIDALE